MGGKDDKNREHERSEKENVNKRMKPIKVKHHEAIVKEEYSGGGGGRWVKGGNGREGVEGGGGGSSRHGARSRLIASYVSPK